MLRWHAFSPLSLPSPSVLLRHSWNVGTGYFGCRNKDGSFSEEKFAKNAQREQVKMIEIKLSQGAKPAHGGLLPGAKVTPTIAEARGVEVGEDCNSPARHSAFSGPVEMMQFAQKLRDLRWVEPPPCRGLRCRLLGLS